MFDAYKRATAVLVICIGQFWLDYDAMHACMDAQLLSHVQLFATPWTIAHQAHLSMEFSRQEYWSGLPFPPPGDLPDPGVEPTSPALAGGFFTAEPPGKYVIPQLAVIKPSLNYLTEVISLLALQTA